MTRQFSIYNIATRLIVSHFRGSINQLSINIPAGHAAIEGLHDPRCKCLAPDSEQVIDYRPPRPDEFHEWDAESKLWALTEARRQSLADAIRAREMIASLEGAQARVLRELTLGDPTGEARRRLERIDAQIANLRKAL